MFLAWRTQLREAQQASELGRLDEAAQRVTAHKLKQYKPGEDFARELARAYLGRSLRRAEESNFAGAGHDLAQAQLLDGASEPWQEAQARVTKLALYDVERLLVGGDYPAAQRQLTQFGKQWLTGDALRHSQEAIRRLESAVNLAKRSRFTEAEQQLTAAIGLRPEWNCLCVQLEKLQAARQSAKGEGETTMTEPSPTPAWPAPLAATTSTKASVGTRLMLWVDAVGGYLVCLADEIWIGQAAPGNAIAVPIQAELARQHAKLTRSGEGYVLEAAHPVSIDGRPVNGKRMLTDGEELELGRGVRIRFRQPHSLSASAKLEIVSRHRTEPHCDGVLLMAESCVLGPKWQNHVVCKDWANDVVLFRQQNALFCRASEPVQIDGVTYDSRGPLQPNSHVSGEDYSFSLEFLG